MIVNTTVNWHNHMIEGNWVSHAHPYDKKVEAENPFKTHHHSDNELILLDRISNFLIVLTSVLMILVFLQLIKEGTAIIKILIPPFHTILTQPYRGPPFSF